MADIGRVRIKATGRSTITSQNFEATPNVSLSEINDVSIGNVQDKYGIIYNASSGQFEAQEIIATDIELDSIIGGTF